MSKVKNKRKKPQSKISKILSSSQTKKDAKRRYFLELSASEIRSNFSEVSTHRFFKSAINLTINKKPRDLYFPQTPSTNLEKNISWCLGLIEFHQEIIQSALNQESTIKSLILSESYSEALNILNDIDMACGISVWSISLRSAIESRIESVNDENSTINKILDDVKDNGVNYILEYSTNRFNEEDIFFVSTRTLHKEIETSAQPIISDFLLYRLFSINIDKKYDFEKIFNFEKNSSILDIFFLLINFVSYAQSPQYNSLFKYNLIHKIVRELSSKFNYPTVYGLATYLGIKKSWEFNKKDLHIIDLYTEGKYQNVCELANNNGLYSYDFSVVELIIKANIRSNNLISPMHHPKIVKHIQNVLLKNEQYDSSLESLAFISHSFRSLRWFRQLLLLVERESAFLPRKKIKYFEGQILIRSEVYSPKLIEIVSNENKEKYLKDIKQASPDSPSVLMYECLLNKNPKLTELALSIDSLRFKKYTADSLLNNGNAQSAIDILYELKLSNDSIISIEASRLLVEALTDQNIIFDAISNVVEMALSRMELLSIFDTHKILAFAAPLIKSSKLINIPIAYSLHSRFSNSEYDPNLKYSFESFLNKNNYTFPNELFGKEEKFGVKKLHYFLKWICTPEIMSLYFKLPTPKDIEDCRLQICNYLMDQGDLSESIQNEVKEINKLRVIKHASKKVENSRIYVDTSIYFGRSSQQYRALFEHFLDLKEEEEAISSDDAIFKNLLDTLKFAKEIKDRMLWKGLSSIYLPKIKLSSKNSTFISLAKILSAEFTHGDRGLNNHLSTRIRHGVLPTALRKPLLDEGLYIPNNLKLEKFRHNPKWHSPGASLSGNNVEKVWKALNSFSKAYEALVSEINDVWLQIYTIEAAANKLSAEQTENGLFDYSISSLECYALQKELPLSPSYDDFIRVIIKWLWDKTDYALEMVQTKLKDSAKTQAYLLFDELTKTILESNNNDRGISEFYNSIGRAKASFTGQLDIICTWFTHVDIDDNERYDLETCLDIAKNSLNVTVTTNNKIECTLSERSLTYMVDVFFILFENAISKSKKEKFQLDLNVKIYKKNENDLILEVTNNCLLEKSIDEHNAELNFYKEAYGNESLIKNKLQEEGGSGFFKIWKILAKDLEIEHEIQMHFTEDNKFFIKLIMHEPKSLTII